MRIDEFEFRNKQGEEIELTKDQLVETDRTVNHFKTKAKEMMKSE